MVEDTGFLIILVSRIIQCFLQVKAILELLLVQLSRERQSLMLQYLSLRVQIHTVDYLQIHILICILNIVITQLLSQGINLLKVVIITEVLVVYNVLIVWMLVIVVHHMGLLVVRSTMTVVVEVVIDMVILVLFLLMHHHGVLRGLVLLIQATNNKVILEQHIITCRLVWIIILQ